MLKKISIVVPIYNTGEYLHKCIKSILAQSLKEFELILVNDGSTDNSGDICDEYVKSDSRVKVIHKRNEGVSIARNVGVEMATGEYIGFIDSDDWIEPDMYCDLYSFAKKYDVDIVMCDTVSKFDDAPDIPDTIVELNNDIILKKNDISPELLKVMAGSACRCIYKSDLIFNNNILFPINIPISEDRVFNIYAFGYAKKVYYVKKPYYNRFIRPGSAVTGYRKNMIDCVIAARNATMQALDNSWDGNIDFKTEYEKQTVSLTYVAINNEFYKQSQDKFKTKIKNIRNICNNQIIRDSVKAVQYNDIRSKLIMNKNALILGFIAFILNKIYKR